MSWVSNLPISEAQKIEGSAHHGHTSPRKPFLGGGGGGANAPQHVVPARFRCRSHEANTFQAMSCLPNALDYVKIECACGHTHLSFSWLATADYTIFTILEAVILDRWIIKARFYEGTITNRWLRKCITLKPDVDGASSKNFHATNVGLCETLPSSF